MTLRINRQAIMHYILIFMLISFQGSAYYKIYENMFLVVGCIISIYAIYVREEYGNPLYNLNGICGGFYVLIILFLLISSITNSGSLSMLSVGNVFARLLLAYAVLTYDIEMFIHRYIKFVYILSCISLVGFALQTVAPDLLLTVLPKVDYGGLYGFLFYMYSPTTHATRNIGMYTEPGLYAIVLCIAIFFLIFYEEKYFEIERKRRISLIVLIIALITAKSTTGYVALIIILLCRFLDIRKNFTTRRSLRWIIALIAAFACVDLLRGSDSIIQTYFLSKLFSNQGMLDLSVSTSGNARIISAIADIQVMIRYPLGAGYGIYEQLWPSFLTEQIWDTSSCAGLTKSLAIYGIPAVTTYFAMLLYFSHHIHPTFMARICCVIVFAVMTLSQPTIFYPAFICMFMISGELDSEEEEKMEMTATYVNN